MSATLDVFDRILQTAFHSYFNTEYRPVLILNGPPVSGYCICPGTCWDVYRSHTGLSPFNVTEHKNRIYYHCLHCGFRASDPKN